MGRLSEARKRAAKKTREGTATPPAPQPETRPPAEPVAQEWIARNEPMTFTPDQPSDAPAPTVGRIQLPPSGLAEDILARVDTAAIVATEPESIGVSEAAATRPRAAATREGALSNISFFASPIREEKKAVEATEHLVTFFLAGEEYGVDVRLVQEIIRVADITQVPRAPSFIKGVINLRGRIIPVIDLKRKLDLGDVEFTRQSRIVVVKVRDRLLGLLVDGASQVLKVALSAIEAPPDEVSEVDSSYLRGVAKLDKRLIILVDLPRILSAETKEPSALATA